MLDWLQPFIEKAASQGNMRIICEWFHLELSFYVEKSGALTFSLPPDLVSNKEVCFFIIFLKNSSIDILHTSREAKGTVDVLGVSGQHLLPLNGPELVACQSRNSS